MDWFKRLGRTEVLIGLAVLLVLGLLAIPLARGGGHKAKRGEVPIIVNEIRAAALAIKEHYGEYYSAKPAPRGPTEVDADTVEWLPSDGFIRLTFEPSMTQLRGSYSVAATEDGFTVTGTCDVDGDGNRAVFKATADTEATMQTADDVF